MKVIIIGAGIGGLTTAIALKQRGIDYEVYEAAPQLKEVGAGIWVPTNAMNVFERLGIAEKIKRAGKLMEEICVGNYKGKIFQTISASEVVPLYGNGTTTIHRGKLQALLYEELDKNKVHTSKKLKHYREEGEKVTAYFEDQTSASGDLLLGADGIHSTVRSQLFGKMPLRYSGQTCWRAATDFKIPSSSSARMCELWGKGNGIRFAYSQMTETQVYFYATMKAPAGGKDQPGELKDFLKKEYSLFGDLAIEIIESATEEKIIRTDLFDLKPISAWTRGRIALLGDAAHATTPNLGQGGAQAIEDGYVMALSLSENKNIESALEKYQSVRYKKAIHVVNTSWQYGKMSNLNNRIAIAFRDFMMANAPKSMGDRMLKKIYELNY
jgi:2-polyprenyl-6-methoxyphenol hydroxylase-like FAD-dependent oxidoreductase